MSAPYDVRAVANLLLGVAQTIGLRVTPLSLQKLLYFCHGQFLIERRVPLVKGAFEAWQHGPVHPYLYHVLKANAANAIIDRLENIDAVTGEVTLVDEPDDDEVREVVDRVLRALSPLTAGQLVTLSHAEGGPWSVAMKRYVSQPGAGPRMGNDLIQQLFGRHLVSSHRLMDSVEYRTDAPPQRYRSG